MYTVHTQRLLRGSRQSFEVSSPVHIALQLAAMGVRVRIQLSLRLPATQLMPGEVPREMASNRETALSSEA